MLQSTLLFMNSLAKAKPAVFVFISVDFSFRLFHFAWNLIATLENNLRDGELKVDGFQYVSSLC